MTVHSKDSQSEFQQPTVIHIIAMHECGSSALLSPIQKMEAKYTKIKRIYVYVWTHLSYYWLGLDMVTFWRIWFIGITKHYMTNTQDYKSHTKAIVPGLKCREQISTETRRKQKQNRLKSHPNLISCLLIQRCITIISETCNLLYGYAEVIR